MDVTTLADKYGWMVAILYIALRDVFPKLWSFFADRLFPERVSARKADDERRDADAKAAREADATLLKARIEREARESDQRLKLEERTVVAIERMEAGISNVNTLLGTLHAAFVQHERFTYNSSMELKEGIEKLHDLEALRKKTTQLEKDVQVITQQNIKKKPS